MKTMLTRLSEEVPVPSADPRSLWRKGRRRRNRMRVAVAAMAALTAMALAALPLANRPQETAGNPQETRTLPSRFDKAYPWQRTWAESPNGPVMAVMVDETRFSEDFLVTTFVGRDGSYRLRYMGFWTVQVSPDGRRAAIGNDILDLATGETIRYADQRLKVMAWSQDGRFLACLDLDGQGAVAVYDTQTGALRQYAVHPYPDAVAFSPDGTMLAVKDSSTLYVYRLADGSTVNGRGTAPGVRLGMWSPDGVSIALVAETGTSGWRLHAYTPATGVYTEDPAVYPGEANGIMGWRGGRPVVSVYLRGESYPSALVVPRAGGGLETLTRARTRALIVPAESVGLPLSDHTAAPSVFAAQAPAYLLLLLLVLLVAAVALTRFCSGAR